MSARSQFSGAASKPSTKPAPFAIRLSPEERAILERRAGNQPLSAYIRECALGSDVRKRRPVRAQRLDTALLSQVLSALGSSRLSSNLNQIAKAANIGTLPVTPDLEADLRKACDDVAAMRRDLVVALGLKDRAAP